MSNLTSLKFIRRGNFYRCETGLPDYFYRSGNRPSLVIAGKRNAVKAWGSPQILDIKSINGVYLQFREKWDWYEAKIQTGKIYNMVNEAKHARPTSLYQVLAKARKQTITLPAKQLVAHVEKPTLTRAEQKQKARERWMKEGKIKFAMDWDNNLKLLKESNPVTIEYEWTSCSRGVDWSGKRRSWINGRLYLDDETVTIQFAPKIDDLAYISYHAFRIDMDVELNSLLESAEIPTIPLTPAMKKLEGKSIMIDGIKIGILEKKINSFSSHEGRAWVDYLTAKIDSVEVEKLVDKYPNVGL